MTAAAQPTLALLHWGDLIEDYLDSIGVSFERFRDEMTGGWMFGYIDALRLAGVRTALICVSARVRAPFRCTHGPTGAPMVVLPVSGLYRAVRRRVPNPYASTLESAAGGPGASRPALLGALKAVTPYLATPLRLLARELRAHRCGAVLCQEYEYARFDACVLIGRLLNLPVFATFQGGNWQMSRLERPVRPYTIQAAAGLIIASKEERERVQRCYGVKAENIAEIFNPLDAAQWAPFDRSAARSGLNLPAEAEVVVWHGRVDIHRKGLDLLIDAWERVCLERPSRDLRLLLVGRGTDSAELRRLLDERSPRGVRWIDEYVLDRGRMRRYLSAGDVYVLPSRHEGFPVALVEAMACGLAAVASDAPGVREILAESKEGIGLVVPRGDAQALAVAIGGVLDDSAQAARLGHLARRRVKELFSLESVGQQLRDFLFARGTAKSRL